MTATLIAELLVKILLLDDSPFIADLIHRALRRAGLKFSSRRGETEATMRASLAEETPDFILCNDLIADIDCFSAIDIARKTCPEVPFIVISSGLGEEGAAECIWRGADEYVLLSNLSRLPAALERAAQRATRVRAPSPPAVLGTKLQTAIADST